MFLKRLNNSKLTVGLKSEPCGDDHIDIMSFRRLSIHNLHGPTWEKGLDCVNSSKDVIDEEFVQ